MIPDDLIRDIKEQQAIIKSGTYLPAYKRQWYEKLEKFLSSKQIIAITGLRQIGKTTLLKQIANAHQSEFNVWYISVDFLAEKTPEMLNEIIYYFIKNSTQIPLIIIDEIQKINNWAEIIKKFYDMHQIKFLLSGSASMQLTKGKESLAGRIIEIYVPPLTFKEFLEFNGEDISKVELSKERSPELLLGYCFKGGLPETAREENLEKLRLLVEDNTINKIIYEDIPEVFKARNKPLLFKLFKHACEISGNIFKYSNLGSVYDVSKDTIKEHLFYLEKSFLLFEVFQHAKGVSKRERNLKKIYVVHPSIAVQMLHYDRNSMNTELAGRFVETAIYNQLAYLFDSVQFWRNEQKKEVDFFIDGKILIEVKYQSRIIAEDLQNIKTALNEFPKAKAIVVTKNTEEKRSGIFLIPAWKFLLMDRKEIEA